MNNLSLMVKPVSSHCNLRCSYCYYSSPGEAPGKVPGLISRDILERILKQGLEISHPHVVFSWQGGEPTLMGFDYFKYALESERRLARAGHVIGNGLQTNGILFDQRWAKLCRQFNVLIGLSIDGPEDIHNTYRRDAKGRGSWTQALRAARLMQEFGIAFSILTVVSQANVRQAREVYDFFRNQGFTGLQFIPCIEPDTESPTGISPESVSSEEYAQFLCELFDCWQNEWQEIYVRLFYALIRSCAGMESNFCIVSPECANALFFEASGDAYTCDFFPVERWRLGNIAETSLRDLLKSEKLKEFSELKRKLRGEECDSCPWEFVCGGGCMRTYPLRVPHDGSANFYCAAFKLFLSYAHPRLEAMSKRVLAWTG